jgi:predicted metal-binding membrane protein
MSERNASTAGRYRPPLAPSDLSTSTSIIVWVALLVLAALAWTVTVFQALSVTGTSGMSGMSGMSRTSGMPPASSPAAPFLSAWIAMMVAMMFPSGAPAVTAFAAVAITRRRGGERVAPAWVFSLGYLAVWSGIGLGAYLLSLIVPEVSMMGPGLRATSPIIAGSILIVAGVYQWSRWKRSCLEHCRSPLALLQEGWHEGAAGAFRLGIANGVQCVGCCGGLMLVLLAVGLMNLGWMAALAAVFFAEKVVPHGPLVGKLAGAAIIITGVAML